ncbi:MAG TPA: BTAD domain-containing putative transcriptional regulator, partial [Chthonomonadales bacterium]|nr:BTAD domain-containing putative transcriptional regulator [Chthonomonadales bacterium]
MNHTIHGSLAVFNEPRDFTMETASLRIKLLGGFEATSFGRQVEGLSPQASALLAFLALNLGRPCTREELADRFWPEADVESGRAGVRQCLYRIRAAIPGSAAGGSSPLKSNRLSVELDAEQVTTDVLQFEALLARHASECHDGIRCLQDAIKLYKGDLLPECYQGCFEPFRHALSAAYRKALQDLIVSLDRAGETDAAIEWARRALAEDPLAEEMHCTLMRLYSSKGQPSAVARQYRELEAVLSEHLSTRPTPEVKELAARLQCDARILLSRGNCEVGRAGHNGDVAHPEANGNGQGNGAHGSIDPAQSRPELAPSLTSGDGAAPVPSRESLVLPYAYSNGALSRGGHTLPAAQAAKRPTRRPVTKALIVPLGLSALLMIAFALRRFGVRRAADSIDLQRVGSVQVPSPSPPCVDAVAHRVYIASRTGNVVYVVDGRSAAVVNRIAVGGGPSYLALNPRTHRLYVSATDEGMVDEIDTTSGAFVRETDVGGLPQAIVVNEETGLVYVANAGTRALDVIDDRGAHPLTTIPIMVRSENLTLDARGGRVYVANSAGGILPVDTDDGTIQSPLNPGEVST